MSENLIVFNRNQRYAYLRIRELSWKAKGLYAYLTSHEGTWEIQHSDLYNRSTDGRDSTLAGLLELQFAKLIHQIRIRELNGQFKWGYVVYSTPIKVEEVIKDIQKDFPEAKITSTVSTRDGKSGYGFDAQYNKVKVIINITKGLLKIDSSKDEYVLPQGATQVPKKLKRRITKEIISTSLKQQSKTTLEPVKTIAPKIKELLDFHSSSMLHKYRSNSEAYLKSAKAIQSLMKGVLFNGLNGKFIKYHNRPFTCEEIKGVLERLRTANSPDYYPSDKKWLKQSLDQLVYNPRISNGDFKSNFLYYFENEPKHCGNGVSLQEDEHPEFTETFKTFYEESIVAGAKQNYTNVQENKFREASKKAIEFFKDNRNRLHGLNQRSYAMMILNAIKDSYQLKEIEIGTLCSKRTWEKIVPVYLADQGILEQVRVL